MPRSASTASSGSVPPSRTNAGARAAGALERLGRQLQGGIARRRTAPARPARARSRPPRPAAPPRAAGAPARRRSGRRCWPGRQPHAHVRARHATARSCAARPPRSCSRRRRWRRRCARRARSPAPAVTSTAPTSAISVAARRQALPRLALGPGGAAPRRRSARGARAPRRPARPRRASPCSTCAAFSTAPP